MVGNCVMLGSLLELFELLLLAPLRVVLVVNGRRFDCRAFLILADVLHLGVLPVDVVNRLFLLLKTIHCLGCLLQVLVLRRLTFGRRLILWLR